MESERKIEKWLRAYAKKRRGQAGDSFKLDSATRRILQNEISRSAPSSEDEEDETMSLWELLRRHWMFFLGFAACIFFLASFYLQSVKPANSRLMASNITTSLGMAPQHLAKREGPVTNTQALALSDNVRTASPAVGAAQPSPHPNQNSPEIAAGTETPPTIFSQNITSGITVTNSTLANSTPPSQPTVALGENAPASAPLAPPQPAPEAPGALPEAQTTAPIPANRIYAMAPTSPSRVPENSEANGGHKAVAAPVSGPAAQNVFMNTVAAQAQPATVLMNFRVVQNGNIIRIVDQDGSVYEGMLHAVASNAGGLTYNTTAVNEGVPAATENAPMHSGTSAQNETTKKVESPRMAESDKASAPPQGEKHWWHWHLHWPSWPSGGLTSASIPAASTPVYPGGPPITDNSAPPLPAVYSFRVGGMNRTLNQPVIFTATLIEDLNAMKSGQTNQTGQLQWSSLRIAGMAIVNRTNQIQINAKPVMAVKNGMPPN